MSEGDSEIGAFMAGFVIGGLVGAATALILAPQSGADTRAQIAMRSDEMIRVGEQQITDYKSRAGLAVSDAQERARIVLDEGKHRMTRVAQKNGPQAAQVTSEQTTESDSSVDDLAGDAPA